MGLDSLWRIETSKEFKEVELSEAHKRILEAHPVCGGLFSAHGVDSFRGKVYSDLVERITGESLYQDYIPPERVKKMAAQLNQTPHLRALPKMGHYPIGAEEYGNLQVMFKVYAENGAGLVGWW